MDVFDRFLAVSTCQVSDGLDRLGLYALGLAGIWPLEPGQPFAGRARTVQFRPKEEVAPGERVEYLEYVEPGDVIVIANGGRIDCSSWGGQRSLGARQRGAVAAVLHGAYRDVEEVRAAGLPVYGVGRTVAGSRHGGIPVAVDVPLSITGCTVQPGDVVVGDASGVIVVPHQAAEDVVREAEALAGRERSTATALADGADFLAYRASLRGAS